MQHFSSGNTSAFCEFQFGQFSLRPKQSLDRRPPQEHLKRLHLQEQNLLRLVGFSWFVDRQVGRLVCWFLWRVGGLEGWVRRPAGVVNGTVVANLLCFQDTLAELRHWQSWMRSNPSPGGIFLLLFYCQNTEVQCVVQSCRGSKS